MQLEEEGNPREPCALPGDAFTVSLQSACPGVQPASPPRARRPLRSRRRLSPSRRRWLRARNESRGRARAHGPRARGREGRKRVITRGRRGPARLRTAPVRTRRPAGPVRGLRGLCPRPALEGPRGEGDAPAELSREEGRAG
ncbi:unnamed protein product [Pipistrellus nathusii]|uniref:Uncharacterized protein n=1 Tax=Pipistrellus nathusii TaxID=59473 RepID=A0ABN9Z3W1_PIPNA